MTESKLWEMVKAWEKQDIEALMEFIADDCIYVTTTGPAPGTVYSGKDEVRRGFIETLSSDSDVQSDDHFGPMFICGNRGVLEWSSSFVNANHERVTVRGCDLFEFDGDKIRRKDAFRKVQA
jgi:ketosteroid isomerase-like protein